MDEVTDSYNRNGFYIHENSVLEVSRVNAARNGLDMIRAGEYDTGSSPAGSRGISGDDPHVLGKISQPQIANTAIAELIRLPEIGECAAAVTGADMVQVWLVQLLYKPPIPEGETGQTNVGWHQDWNYWHPTWEDPSELLTAWIALCDVGATSGPMNFVRGSHRWKNVGGGDFFSQDIGQKSFSIPESEVWQEIPAVMKVGGLSLHDKLTLHGSGQNTSGQPRCSLAMHLRTDKSRPVDGGRKGHARFIDDLNICPVIYGSRVESAFV